MPKHKLQPSTQPSTIHPLSLEFSNAIMKNHAVSVVYMTVSNAKIRRSTDSVDLLYAIMTVPCIQMNAIFLMQHKIPTCVHNHQPYAIQSCESTINVLQPYSGVKCNRESHNHMHMKACPNQTDS